MSIQPALWYGHTSPLLHRLSSHYELNGIVIPGILLISLKENVMEMKEAIIVSTIRNDRTFQFVIPKGAQYGETYDAAYEVLTNIANMAHSAAEGLKPSQNTTDTAQASS